MSVKQELPWFRREDTIMAIVSIIVAVVFQILAMVGAEVTGGVGVEETAEAVKGMAVSPVAIVLVIITAMQKILKMGFGNVVDKGEPK